MQKFQPALPDVVGFISQSLLQLGFRHHITYSLLNWFASFEMLIGTENPKIKEENCPSFAMLCPLLAASSKASEYHILKYILNAEKNVRNVSQI